MDAFANALIDAMGGTTAVATRAKTGVSTVHHWRRTGLSPSRLDHLCRIAHDELPSLDLEAIAEEHGVQLPFSGEDVGSSVGKAGEISGSVAA
ncbi:hypothetical protein GGR47_001524 [Sphingomonas aquatilis]|uniref:XRE family transcriptional regulator n=2 Tax=Sphingomonas aquatilis TaxID=93063 RepID=A0AAW3TRP4_9SPHN|nr:hypothetical protein [Sphingomonas aquatilis]MBB3875289.1 hypothetical protein [Sphingomonas aquatilis]